MRIQGLWEIAVQLFNNNYFNAGSCAKFLGELRYCFLGKNLRMGIVLGHAED